MLIFALAYLPNNFVLNFINYFIKKLKDESKQFRP